MKLTKKALKRLNQLEPRLKMAMAFQITERSVSRLIKDNKIDGQLTRASALKIIRELTGLTDDQILEETEPVRA